MSLDATANFLRHSPEACTCVECQETNHLVVSNANIQPAELFLKVESAISELQVPELTDQIKTFYKMICKQARNIVAAYILN